MHDYYAALAPEYDWVYLKPDRQVDLLQNQAMASNRLWDQIIA